MMPEKDALWGLVPWLIGIVAAIVGVALRNEWTTSKMHTTLYDENGDLRLVRGNDCEKCRIACKTAFVEAFEHHRQDYERYRGETHGEINTLRTKLDDEIKRLHEKIDSLPERIIKLLRNNWRPD
jgi:hypothetical protein